MRNLANNKAAHHLRRTVVAFRPSASYRLEENLNTDPSLVPMPNLSPNPKTLKEVSVEIKREIAEILRSTKLFNTLTIRKTTPSPSLIVDSLNKSRMCARLSRCYRIKLEVDKHGLVVMLSARESVNLVKKF